MPREQLLDEALDRAIRIAAENGDAGAPPFGAVVLAADGSPLGEGVNAVASERDPTAHAEVQAIRAATRDRGLAAPRGGTLVASGEPCGLCFVVAAAAGIAAVVSAASQEEAAEHGYDYRSSYRLLDRTLPLYVHRVHRPRPTSAAPFTGRLRSGNG